MSAEETLRLRVQSLVARGLAAPEVRRRAGLAAASEVWGGDAPRDRAAWYLWLEGIAGAFQLELAGAEPLDGAERSVVGRLVVRHYPAAGTPLLASFDPEERRAAAEWLDATCTPRIDAAARIPEHLFTVGAVDWAVDLDADASLFALASQDRLRTREGGSVVRDVPGWRLCAPVLSALVSLHAQLDRRAATRLVVGRERGFEVVRGEDGVSIADAGDLVQGEALVAVSTADGCGAAAARLLAATREGAAEVVLDVPLVRGARATPPGGDPRLALEPSPAWFGGEAHFEGATCAC